MSRQDQFVTYVSVQRVPGGPLVRIPESFDTCNGGQVSATSTKHRPGGSSRPRSFGGPSDTDNVTVGRFWDLTRDDALVKQLMKVAGWAAASIERHPTDAQMTPSGAPTIWTGTLLRVKPPDHDSNSSSVAMWELEFETAGTVG
jgi:hypothetical protein